MKLELSYEKIRQMIDKNRSALNFLVLILLFSTCSNNDSSELSLAEISSDDEIILQDTTTTTLQDTTTTTLQDTTPIDFSEFSDSSDCNNYFHHDKERNIEYWGGLRAQVRDVSCYPEYQIQENVGFNKVIENFENDRCIYETQSIEYFHPAPVKAKAAYRYGNIAVIPVTFADTPQSVKDMFPTQQDINDMIFGSGNKITEYFNYMSNGLYKYEGHVFPTINLEQDMVFDEYGMPDLNAFLVKKKYSYDGSEPNNENVVNFIIEDFFESPLVYDVIIFIPIYHDFTYGGWANSSKYSTPTINGVEIKDDHTWVISLPLIINEGDENNPPRTFTDTWSWFPLPYFDEYGNQAEGNEDQYLNPLERTLIHELIHTFGIGTHANSMISDGIPYYQEKDFSSNEFFFSSYGDLFDVMGRASYSQNLNAAFRAEIGWLNSLMVSDYELRSVVLGDNLSIDSNNIQAIHLNLPGQYFREQEFDINVTSCMFNKGYFIEYISSNSPYANRINTEWLKNNKEGVFVRYFDGGTSQLLDMSPSKFVDLNGYIFYDITDVVLKPGEVFEDGYVYIHNKSRNADGTYNIDIQIKENKTPWGW